jgi:hypothetical protein
MLIDKRPQGFDRRPDVLDNDDVADQVFGDRDLARVEAVLQRADLLSAAMYV